MSSSQHDRDAPHGAAEPPQGPTYVGPREWPPPEMRWPPPTPEQQRGAANVDRASALDERDGSIERPAPFTTLLLFVLIAALAQIGGVLLLGAWSRLTEHADELRTLSGEALLARAAELPGGLELMVLSIQVPLLAFAFLLAAPLPGGVARGLGLERPRLRARTWIVALLGTLALAALVAYTLDGWIEPSENLKLLSEGMRARPVPLVVVLAVLAPGVCEEIFFRGWLQRRLRVAWGAWLSVLLSAGLFAAYHMEPAHILAVSPLALWIAWWGERTRSTWLCIACHVVNNGAACALLLAQPPQ